MRVFISWSGDRSLAVARELRTWLEETLQSVKPWISDSDIRAGARWVQEINKQLSKTKFGVICLTHENQHAPWVLFEAGALAKALEGAFVVPYLIDMEPSDIKPPLSQFDARKYNEQGTLQLLQSMNKALGEDSLADETLKRVFARNWPSLEQAFENIEVPAKVPAQKPRSTEEVTREVLELVRSLSRRLDAFPTRRELAALDLARRTSRGDVPFDRRSWETIEELRREEMMFDDQLDRQAEDADRLEAESEDAIERAIEEEEARDEL